MSVIPDILIPVIADIRTKEERDVLRDQISKLEAALYHADPEILEKILQTRIPETLAEKMRNMIDELKLRDHPEAIKKFFQDFYNALQQLPLMRIGIAFTPTEEMVTCMHQWTKDNLGQGIILDINFDRSILGGAKIIFAGRYKEMTLAQMINDVFIKEKSAIKKIIQH